MVRRIVLHRGLEVSHCNAHRARIGSITPATRVNGARGVQSGQHAVCTRGLLLGALLLDGTLLIGAVMGIDAHH